jgi:hypothetical protein
MNRGVLFLQRLIELSELKKKQTSESIIDDPQPEGAEFRKGSSGEI